MSKKNKHINKYLEDFLNYSGDNMPGSERNAFERDLQKDPFEAEAMEGLDTVSADEAREDMADIQRRLIRRTHRSGRFVIYRIAAAITVILGIGTMALLLTTNSLDRFLQRSAVTENTRMEEEKPITYKEPSAPVIEKEIVEESESLEPEIPSPTEITEGKQAAGQAGPESTGSKKDIPLIIEDENVLNEVEAELKTDDVIIQDQPVKGIVTEAVPVEVFDEEMMARKLESDRSAMAAFKQKRENRATEVSMPAIRGENIIRGLVLSAEDNTALPGVSVFIKGTNIGTITDSDGHFELDLENDKPVTLVAEFIGMEYEEMQSAPGKDIKFELQPSIAALDEVVVIGYGVPRTADLTGAASTIKTGDVSGGSAYQPAQPVPGYLEFSEYISNNIKYPSGDSIHRKEMVVLSFFIGENGRPTNINVLKSPGEEFSREAIRLLKWGPEWYPAQKDGVFVEEETRIRIVFKPENDL